MAGQSRLALRCFSIHGEARVDAGRVPASGEAELSLFFVGKRMDGAINGRGLLKAGPARLGRLPETRAH